MIHLGKQQTKILQLLRMAGSHGINSYDLRFKFHLIQAPVRILEMKAKGFLITTRNKNDRSVDYILVGEPEKVILVEEKEKAIKYYIPGKEKNSMREVNFEEYQKYNQPIQERMFL